MEEHTTPSSIEEPTWSSSMEEFKSSPALDELAAALAKCQAAITPPKKDSDNPFYRSKYADLAAVWESMRKPLSDHGLCVIQGPFSIGEKIAVRTRLIHSSGQWIESVVSAFPKDSGPQAVGSVITYLRRYAVSAMVGIAAEDEDDDGNAATPKQERAQTQDGRSRTSAKDADYSQWTPTEEEVPGKYWTLRKTDPKAAAELLGGPGRRPLKVNDKWVIGVKNE